MRKRIWITCIIVLAVCLMLLLKTKQQYVVTLPKQGEMSTNQQPMTYPTQAGTLEKFHSASVPNAGESSSRPTKPMPTEELQRQELAAWQAPIDFYGKVIDENSNAVAGAKIDFQWVETPTKDGTRTSSTESDADGLFSIRDKRGPSLIVGFSKEGYYSSHHGQMGFNYALGPDILSPDPQNPVTFLLHKKGQGVDLITSDNGMRPNVWVRLPKDNTSVRVDFFQKQVSATGQLEISQLKPPFQTATNWSFRMSIPDGGLVENQDEFQFAAPESGYQPTVEYDFEKNETNWTTQVTKQFYIVFGQPRKYGWLRIESNLAQETVFLTYAINPSGSQNLEPAK